MKSQNLELVDFSGPQDRRQCMTKRFFHTIFFFPYLALYVLLHSHNYVEYFSFSYLLMYIFSLNHLYLFIDTFTNLWPEETVPIYGA